MSRHVAIDQQVASRAARQRAHALLERLTLVAEGQLGALVAERLAMPQASDRSFASPMIRPVLARHRCRS